MKITTRSDVAGRTAGINVSSNRNSGNSSLFKSASIYLIAAALTAGIPLIFLPILTRIFSPEEYGKVAMFSAAVQIFGTVTGLSIHGAIGMRYFDRETLDFPRYVSSCLIILLTSTTVTLLSAIVALPWLENFTQLPASWLILAVLFSGSGFIVQAQLSIWQSSRQAFKFGMLRVGQGVMDLSGSVLLIFVLGLTWQGRVGGIVAAGFITSALAIVTLTRGRWLRLPHDSQYAKNALRFGLPLVPHAAGGILIAMVDRILITNILDISTTGIYVVAAQMGIVLNLANDALNRAYSPSLIEALKFNDANRDVKIVRLTYVYFLCLIVIAIAFGTVAPKILGAIVGPKFQEAAPMVIFMALGQAFGGMYSMVATYVFYAGRTASLAVITLATGLLNVAITYWLLKSKGLIGASQAFMVTQFIFFLGTWVLAQRCRPMPWLRALLASR
jgi:O-antigen/teichoic acid export membrane protein